MNCGEIRDFIIEYNGNIENAPLDAVKLAGVKSHLASCKKCALLRQHMIDMSAAIAADKINIPSDLTAGIISRVMPAHVEKTKLVIKTFSRREPGFIEKIASFFWIAPEKFAVAFPAFIIAALAFGIIIYGYGFNTAGRSPLPDADKIAESGNSNTNNLKNSTDVIKDAVDKKFKKVDDTVYKKIAGAGNEVEKKFKKDIFTVERGSLAAAGKEILKVNSSEDLIINYKKVASIIIKTESKFKINDDGIILESGMVFVDLKPASLSSFSVITPESIVEVVGTVFSVSSFSGKTEVKVKKGCVKVTDLKTKESFLLKPGNFKIISFIAGDAFKHGETAPVIIEYGSNDGSDTADVCFKDEAGTVETQPVSRSENENVSTVPVKIEGANIKDVIDSFKNGTSD